MTRTFHSNNDTKSTIKFLYSYGGQILPRRTDGELRYVGGYTRVLAVDRSITFAELMVKFGELCGSSMCLKCKLPKEDLDVLVSITSEEDLASVIEEYDRTDQDLKIRVVLSPLKSLKKISPPPSAVSSVNFSSWPSKSAPYAVAGFCSAPPQAAAKPAYRYGCRNSSPFVGFPVGVQQRRCYPLYERESTRFLVPR
ncbi:protein PAL OF QUIRKY [Cornus florida]|uniref:protein PAL OF QUIRKY n=1 Tax=Cornus florida TaxID=4283 RepID=UPI00289B3F40|nr:protein PAL OF QUIRKY [Cornus florida]